ncbi:hypothetical protein APR12_003366 [Nocardia amikacinitolerans]|nr:hypothetical protein [Nocardia amikacinitolerans]
MIPLKSCSKATCDPRTRWCVRRSRGAGWVKRTSAGCQVVPRNPRRSPCSTPTASSMACRVSPGLPRLRLRRMAAMPLCSVSRVRGTANHRRPTCHLPGRGASRPDGSAHRRYVRARHRGPATHPEADRHPPPAAGYRFDGLDHLDRSRRRPPRRLNTPRCRYLARRNEIHRPRLRGSCGDAAAKPLGPGDAPIAVLPDVEGIAAGVADLDDVAGDDEVVEPGGVGGGEVQAAV